MIVGKNTIVTEFNLAHLSQNARTVRAEDVCREVREQLGDFSVDLVYRDRILTQRTRRYELHAAARASNVEILHTLLGVELKIGRRRLLCPDLATARYLSVFARVGCEAIAIPYDITQVSHVADLLESGLSRMLLLIAHLTEGRSSKLRQAVARRLFEEIRGNIASLGSGARIPEFNQNTRQRR
ncbi:MAG: hypothetical protein DMF61_23800 [Blastocatellia bacterium AA13]|nr:MAG: hypothetical protein DMF61_23800 [Blastocatellia bacterium AA13]